MDIAIIISLKDKAALNIKKNLLETNLFRKTNELFEEEIVYEFNDEIKLYTIKEFSIYAEKLDEKIDADFFLFPTKHKSEKGVPSLSVHSPGNFGKAAHGGNEKELSFCLAKYLKKAMQLLEKNNLINFDVVQECTHHGPSIKKPCIFIEIGSTETEWVRDDAGKVISDTIIELLKGDISQYKTAFGIGGLHTTPNFKKIQLTCDIAVGHVCPKYNLENLNKEMILQALEKTIPKSELIIVDWKGLGEHKERIVKLLDEINVEWKKTKDY